MGVPAGTEKKTGGVDEEQMIIIIVCVGLIVLIVTVAAIYFLGIKRWKEEKGVVSFSCSEMLHNKADQYIARK